MLTFTDQIDVTGKGHWHVVVAGKRVHTMSGTKREVKAKAKRWIAHTLRSDYPFTLEKTVKRAAISKVRRKQQKHSDVTDLTLADLNA